MPFDSEFKVNNICTSETYSRQMKSFQMLLYEVLKSSTNLKAQTQLSSSSSGKKLATES